MRSLGSSPECSRLKPCGSFEFFTNTKGDAIFSGWVPDMGMDIFHVDNYATGFDYIAGFNIP